VWTLRAWSVVVASLFCSVTMSAQVAVPERTSDRSGGSFAFYIDNDVFITRRDRDYSNGVRLAWLSRSYSADEAGLLGRLATIGLTSNHDIARQFGVSLTQLMFHPDYREFAGQPAGERRYAGWLALGFSAHAIAGNALNSVELSVGTTGPRSLVRETQEIVHFGLGFVRFEGWHEQVPNELTVDVILRQQRRFRLAAALDAFVEGAVQLGTFRTEAVIGGTLRFGYNLPDGFFQPRITSTAYAFPQPQREAWSLFGFIGGTARGVLHDATLDGPVFTTFETGNTREPVVGELYLGAGVRHRRLSAAYAQTLRTRDYEEQSGLHSFGSFVVGVEF
jgi:lipid A 3-O-deacylase